MTNDIFKCPYCGSTKYSKSSAVKGSFKNWTSVSRHVSKCSLNTGDYYITETLGCIYIPDYAGYSYESLKSTFPTITSTHTQAILKKLRLLKLIDASFTFRHHYSDKEIIDAIKRFVKQTGKVPGIRDFGSHNPEYPNHDTVKKHFGSWNAAIEAAGFTKVDSGFGTNTLGLDGHEYRSRSEAYFADNYLFGNYTYDIEPKYPESYRRYYDWYIHELDLYLELDGGLRPDVIVLKMEINKVLGRSCVVIPVSKIYNIDYVNAALAQR